METAAILLVTAAVAFITWLFLLDKKRRDLDKLGGPKSLPLIGNVHQLSRHPGGRLNTRQFNFFDEVRIEITIVVQIITRYRTVENKFAWQYNTVAIDYTVFIRAK